MKQIIAILVAGALLAVTSETFAQSIPVGHFHKVIVSPYIQVNFVQGDVESVTINQIKVDSNKLHVVVRGGALRLYLEGARDFPHNRRYQEGDGNKTTHQLYPDHSVVATVVYRKLDALSLRGTENYVCQSPMSGDKFTLHAYGEATVIFTEVHFNRMYAAIYGEGSLEIRSGVVKEQYYTSYGDGKINSTSITGQVARLTSFGDGEFRMNVSDRISITAFGDARIRYMGNPDIVKGIHLGDLDLLKLD